MKVSIITACYNSSKTIFSCLESLQTQTYSSEHIIIDGGSRDRTLDIIEKNKFPSTRIVSESDKGIYDALNKGIGMATGEVVGILHADDFYGCF